jgi:hypothetical protein
MHSVLIDHDHRFCGFFVMMTVVSFRYFKSPDGLEIWAERYDGEFCWFDYGTIIIKALNSIMGISFIGKQSSEFEED